MLELPSGRLVRGSGLRSPRVGVEPTFGVYLVARRPPSVAWESAWIRWPDFWLPSDRQAAQRTLEDAWRIAEAGRVEIACGGGRGRTGTALACLAILDGVPSQEAVRFVRDRYDRRAVEGPWQRRYVEHFHTPTPASGVK